MKWKCVCWCVSVWLLCTIDLLCKYAFVLTAVCLSLAEEVSLQTASNKWMPLTDSPTHFTSTVVSSWFLHLFYRLCVWVFCCCFPPCFPFLYHILLLHFFLASSDEFFYTNFVFLFTIHKFKSFLLCPTFIHSFIHLYISAFHISMSNYFIILKLFSSCENEMMLPFESFSLFFVPDLFFSVLFESNDSQFCYIFYFYLIWYLILSFCIFKCVRYVSWVWVVFVSVQ